MKKRLLATLLISALVLALLPATAFAQTATVSTFGELQAALSDSAVDTIVVTAEIILPAGRYDGDGKTIRVPTPYMNEDGTARDGASTHRVFSIASGSAVTLTNMTVMGGGAEPQDGSYIHDDYAGAIRNAGTLYMDDVIITRSCRGLSNGGTAILTNCYITRNACDYGGGLLNTGRLVMDGCSLSENRSLRRGGGAAENKSNSGTMYVNNCVIANNSSHEIGGAINNYRGTLYIMNTTVSGNVSIHNYYEGYGARSGGGIGYNGGRVNAANCIFADNYAKKLNGDMTRSDIGLFSGNAPSLRYCMLGAVVSNNDSSSGVSAYPTCIPTTETVFDAYRSDGIPYLASDRTADFSHAVLVSIAGKADARYAPLRNGSPAATGGVYATYIDYTTLSDVKMSYQVGNTDTPTVLSGTATTANPVTGYFEPGTRTSGVMGASGVGDITDYFVTLGPYKHGTVQGASIYGNSYPAGTHIEVTATANDYAVFEGWKIDDEATPSVTDNPYRFTLTRDVKLTPVFTPDSYTVSFDMNGGPGAIADKTAFYNEDMPAITSAEMPNRVGYNFYGFCDEATGGGTWYYNSDGTSANKWDKTADATLYAQWYEESYWVEYFDIYGAPFSGENDYWSLTHYHQYGTDTQLTAPIKTGFTGALYTDAACTGTPITTLSATGYTADIDLYTKWTVPISISPRNTFVQGNAPGNLTVHVGQTGSIPSNGNFGSLEIGADGTGFSVVDEANYEVTYGSIHIALAQDWLNTLAPGEYTLRVNLAGATFAGISPTTQLIVTAPGAGDAEADIPQAGDGSTPLLWAGLMLLAGVGLYVRRRRRA